MRLNDVVTNSMISIPGICCRDPVNNLRVRVLRDTRVQQVGEGVGKRAIVASIEIFY